jgi:hypothetical protein
MESLHTILALPPHPVESGAKDKWSRIERNLGIRLPEDYKSFINQYGTGSIADFIWVFSPFTVNRHLNLETQVRQVLEGFKTLQAMFKDKYLFPLYPEIGGILPFAGTDNGNHICWLTDGPENDWPVIVFDSRSPECERYNCTMTEFLVNILTKRQRCSLFPEDFPPDDVAFRCRH